MNVIVKEGVVIIESDGVVLELIMKDTTQRITDVMSVIVKADDIVSEVQKDLDMDLNTIVSGEFNTYNFYGVSHGGLKVFIPRHIVRKYPDVFNLALQTAKLPFYIINNRYSVNSVTKERHEFVRVFTSEEEMMKAYLNTIKCLDLNALTANKSDSQ